MGCTQDSALGRAVGSPSRQKRAQMRGLPWCGLLDSGARVGASLRLPGAYARSPAPSDPSASEDSAPQEGDHSSRTTKPARDQALLRTKPSLD